MKNFLFTSAILLSIHLLVGCTHSPVKPKSVKLFSCEQLNVESGANLLSPEDVDYDWTYQYVYVSAMDGNSGIYASKYIPNGSPEFTPLTKVVATNPHEENQANAHRKTHGMYIVDDDRIEGDECLYVIDHVKNKKDNVAVYKLSPDGVLPRHPCFSLLGNMGDEMDASIHRTGVAMRHTGIGRP